MTANVMYLRLWKQAAVTRTSFSPRPALSRVQASPLTHPVLLFVREIFEMVSTEFRYGNRMKHT